MNKEVCPSCRYSGKLVQVDLDGNEIEGGENIPTCWIETEIMQGKAECPYWLERMLSGENVEVSS